MHDAAAHLGDEAALATARTQPGRGPDAGGGGSDRAGPRSWLPPSASGSGRLAGAVAGGRESGDFLTGHTDQPAADGSARTGRSAM
ncbi:MULTISPECIES: hypothetical protein [unclassified Streptomyces]|uniref:hypothetical protein n=1 Tax=unclassified Streptomyces TaxID=2593676 RepID=UPI003447D327